jgi:hypothetical protein
VSAHANPTNGFPELPQATPLEEIRDICRESELTPGEVHAEYLNLNGQITAHLDAFVGKLVDATEEFKNLILPLLDQMQSMLSKRGRLRKLLNIAGIQTWEEWFEDFEKRLHLDITFRTIQRWLKRYRFEKGEEPPSKDVNVTAKESIRNVESKKQAKKFESVVKELKQLNPAIHADLIRALKADVKKKLALIANLEKGFKPLRTSTGKALQRLVRERRAKLPDPLLEEKEKLAADFKNATVKQIPYSTAKNVILANEYLGTMPGGVTNCFGLYFGKHLAAVECFGSTGGSKLAASVCGPEFKDKVTVLVRGATEHWADPPRTSADGRTHTGGAASHLIAEACKLMAAKGKPITIAIADPRGGERGQIYSAVNFVYTGMTKGTEDYIDADGKRHNTRQIHGLTRDRRDGQLKYKRTRAAQKEILLKQGCKFERVGVKHRYVLFSGDRHTKKLLRKALKWKEVLPHPRRKSQATATSA